MHKTLETAIDKLYAYRGDEQGVASRRDKTSLLTSPRKRRWFCTGPRVR